MSKLLKLRYFSESANSQGLSIHGPYNIHHLRPESTCMVWAGQISSIRYICMPMTSVREDREVSEHTVPLQGIVRTIPYRVSILSLEIHCPKYVSVDIVSSVTRIDPGYTFPSYVVDSHPAARSRVPRAHPKCRLRSPYEVKESRHGGLRAFHISR